MRTMTYSESRAKYAETLNAVVDDEHRLIYKIAEDEIRIAACRYHYGS